MRRLLPALLLCTVLALSAADCGGDARAESPKPRVTGLGITAAGDTLTARWTWKSALLAVDTGVVTWSQKVAPSTTWLTIRTQKTRGTSDTFAVAAPAAGTSDSVRVCVVVKRVGAADSPTACARKGRSTAQPPSPGADSVTLSQLILRTVPADGHAIATVAGQVSPGDTNRVQVCAFGVLSDGRRVKLENSWGIPACETAYQSWLAERQV